MSKKQQKLQNVKSNEQKVIEFLAQNKLDLAISLSVKDPESFSTKLGVSIIKLLGLQLIPHIQVKSIDKE